MNNISPAEQALEHSLYSTGIEVDTKELSRLVKLLARQLPPGENRVEDRVFIDLLCDLRRKKWASQLSSLSQNARLFWVTPEDIRTASAQIDIPAPTSHDLLGFLNKVTEQKMRLVASTAQQALEHYIAEIGEIRPAPLTPAQAERLALAIAQAFKQESPQHFAEQAAQQFGTRQQQAEEMQQRGRKRREQALDQLKNWEKSLVDFKAIPALLHCSSREALRWIAEQRIPVARRYMRKGREIWEFDPVEIKKLRPLLPQWRERKGPVIHKPRQGFDIGDKSVGNATIARIAALDRYASHFATARALKRKITLVTGPTNSGKSYTALQALSQSESGYALAPLRLLAHEFRETLAEAGVEASLATGEERIVVPHSKHLAATVEMCPFHNPVDVALIDEAQMLHDPERGAAWTAAIMGVPARHVYILGAPECVFMVRRIAELCNDPLDEISLERKSPLVAAPEPIKLSTLKAGDALIAFSRREVLDLRAALLAQGKKVAVVYGALSPEVRRAEARRFNTGEADILIATDAIGMGLNLRIKRIIFAALKKYDGHQVRDLNSQEVKQIGGRAGRYGYHEQGIVGVLAGAGNPRFIAHHLQAPIAAPEDLRPQVQPDIDIISAIADEIHSDSLFGVLTRIERAVLREDDPNYRLADMRQAFDIASSLEGIPDLDLAQRWTYALCPVDERDQGIERLTQWALDHATGRLVYPPGTGRLPPPEKASREELEKAEKRYKRLVAWRWLSLRFPQSYPDLAQAEQNSAELNDWIEKVLRQQSRMKIRH